MAAVSLATPPLPSMGQRRCEEAGRFRRCRSSSAAMVPRADGPQLAACQNHLRLLDLIQLPQAGLGRAGPAGSPRGDPHHRAGCWQDWRSGRPMGGRRCGTSHFRNRFAIRQIPSRAVEAPGDSSALAYSDPPAKAIIYIWWNLNPGLPAKAPRSCRSCPSSCPCAQVGSSPRGGSTCRPRWVSPQGVWGHTGRDSGQRGLTSCPKGLRRFSFGKSLAALVMVSQAPCHVALAWLSTRGPPDQWWGAVPAACKPGPGCCSLG